VGDAGASDQWAGQGTGPAGGEAQLPVEPADSVPEAGLELSPGAGTQPVRRARSTRASAVWTALAVGLALLIVVVVFILENLQDVKVTFFGLHWKIPLALDLLLAAALGGAVVFTAGALRMLQLRLHGRRRAHGRPSNRAAARRS
jgi:uncharacterized integral membrane protein